MDETPDYTALNGCGHMFCDDCWGSHLSIAIKEAKTIIPCMHAGCNNVVPDYLIQKLTTKDVFDKYARFLSKNFVESSGDVRWCTAPGCTQAIYDRLYFKVDVNLPLEQKV